MERECSFKNFLFNQSTDSDLGSLPLAVSRCLEDFIDDTGSVDVAEELFSVIAIEIPTQSKQIKTECYRLRTHIISAMSHDEYMRMTD